MSRSSARCSRRWFLGKSTRARWSRRAALPDGNSFTCFGFALLTPAMASSCQSPPPASPGLLPDMPPISALFLINFDVKAGYTIVWKQHLPGIDVEGAVEYKSLPSGLHTVHNDLIYFIHQGHAGLSAFVNMPCEDEELRHARMISVGVLVPLSYGRLGRAWRHASSLMEIAENTPSLFVSTPN